MKVLYVSTVSSTINAFLIPHIKLLIENGYKVDLACNVVNDIDDELFGLGCRVYNMDFQRSPFKKDNYKAYKKLRQLILDECYYIVHTHTPVASALVRLACKDIEDIKVVYTAHGFHFYKGAPLINWLLYYPIERLLARYTDVLITINREDYERANSFKAGRVEYIPGVGIDLNKFKPFKGKDSHKRKEIDLPEDAFVLLSVGELNKNKNHETVIKALAKINDPNVCYIICGQGPLKNYLTDLIKDFGLEKQVFLLGYRRDMAEIYGAVDLFVFPSFREGLSVALMEAMASGLPVVCSNIRGNRDLIKNNLGGYLVNANDIEGFAEKIERIKLNPSYRQIFGEYNSKIVMEYDIDKVVTEIGRLYSQL